MKIILFSKSPRRQDLLKLMGYEFNVVSKDVDESYPSHLSTPEIAEYIAVKKVKAFDDELNDEIIISADTLVAIGNEILGKPADATEASNMLWKLSGKQHQVFTGVSILHKHKIISFTDITHVTFKNLTELEINYYIENYKPYDKAGAYGIQEWIGLVAVTEIQGSYTNVMGLPTEKLYATLKEITA